MSLSSLKCWQVANTTEHRGGQQTWFSWSAVNRRFNWNADWSELLPADSLADLLTHGSLIYLSAIQIFKNFIPVLLKRFVVRSSTTCTMRWNPQPSFDHPLNPFQLLYRTETVGWAWCQLSTRSKISFPVANRGVTRVPSGKHIRLVWSLIQRPWWI